jgi:hypothetical protein
MVELGALSRRDVLKITGGVGAAGVAGAYGLGAFDRAPDAAATEMSDEESRELAEQFAPVYYFDSYEKWFPTDPRPYETEADGETIVDGFLAFDGYSKRFQEEGAPPNPTVFYRVLEYEDSPLAVVQYWWYAAFDQFSVNFHWHDWELTQVFVDTESGDPQLFVGSAHSRKVPNNEFLDPETAGSLRVLPELGSHSGGLSVNEIADRFTRSPFEDITADITNNVLEGVEFELPAAYGLPRDEGFRLPYVAPELDGEPIHEHEKLPSVEQESLIAAELTVSSYEELASPPEHLPARETGEIFAFDAADVEADAGMDISYDLVSTAELEHISAFTGPQLSFEFTVPEFGEDLAAGHITTTGVPWEQPRYDDPASDVTDPAHRQTLADRYDAIAEPTPVNRLIAAVRQTEPDEEAPEDEGVTTTESSVEAVCLVESDPEAVPTFAGVAVLEDMPEGDHRMTVNGAGLAPHSEQVTVTETPEPDLAGVDGEIAVPAAGEAVKLEVDAEGTDADLQNLAIEDDFGGRIYDAPMDGPDAVYVHRGGAYTTEVRDSDDELGAFRVNPDTADVRIDQPRTGKASLSEFLANISVETRGRVETGVDLDDIDDTADTDGTGSPRDTTDTTVGTNTAQTSDGNTTDTDTTQTSDGNTTDTDTTQTSDGNTTDTDTTQTTDSTTTDTQQTTGVRGLLQALDAVAASADRARERAEAGDGTGADKSLEAVQTRLKAVADRLEEASDDLPDPISSAIDRRLEQARRRTEQALTAEKL